MPVILQAARRRSERGLPHFAAEHFCPTAPTAAQTAAAPDLRSLGWRSQPSPADVVILTVKGSEAFLDLRQQTGALFVGEDAEEIVYDLLDPAADRIAEDLRLFLPRDSGEERMVRKTGCPAQIPARVSSSDRTCSRRSSSTAASKSACAYTFWISSALLFTYIFDENRRSSYGGNRHPVLADDVFRGLQSEVGDLVLTY